MKTQKSGSEATAWLIFKINILVVGFGLVLYVSHTLSNRGFSPTLKAFLGLSASPSDSFSISWCDTRVKAISFADGQRVYQEGYNWYRQAANQGPIQLNFLNVEKWFAEYCKITAQPESEAQSKEVAITIEFIDGRVEQIKSNGDDIFQWRDRPFKSPEFADGLAAGRKLQ